MIKSFGKGMKVVNVSLATVAGTSTVTSSVVDCAGFDSIAFIAITGDATSGTVLTLTAKQNTANSTSSPTPTTPTGATATYTSTTTTDADEKTLIVDVPKIYQRYMYATLARATQNCVMNAMIAILYNPIKAPITADSSNLATTVVAADVGA